MQQIKREYVDSGQVRVVYRHFIVLGPESLRAAEAAECAGDQGKFFPYHDLLFQNQGPENSGYLTDQRLIGFAQQLGLATDRFSQCLTSGKYQSQVRESTQEAGDIGLPGVPTVYVNRSLVQNPLDLNELRSVIQKALKQR